MFSGYRRELENAASLKNGSVPFRHARSARMLSRDGMPDEVLRSGRGWEIRNQLQEGSCTGHMITAAGEDLAFLAGNDGLSLSPDYSYYTAQELCGLIGSDQGATIEAACESGMNGFVLESDLPYTPAYNPQSVTQEIRKKAKGKIKRRSLPKSPDEWVTWNASGQGGTLLGVPWTRNFQRYDGQGVVRDLGSTSGVGWHAIYQCGYSLKMLPTGEVVFEVKNSHSVNYGRSGYLYFSMRVAVQLCDAEATAVSVSDIEEWENPVLRSPVRMAEPFLGT